MLTERKSQVSPDVDFLCALSWPQPWSRPWEVETSFFAMTLATNASTGARERKQLTHCRVPSTTSLWRPESGAPQRRRWDFLLRPWHSGEVEGPLGSEA